MNIENKDALLWAARTIRTALNDASDTIASRARDARRNGEDEYRHILAVVNALDYLAGEFAVEEQDTVRETAENWAYGLTETARAMGQFLDNADQLAREDAEAEAEKERKADEQFRVDLTGAMMECGCESLADKGTQPAARTNERALQTAVTEKEAANVR